MRTLIISLLLASAAATPALAQDSGPGDPNRDRVSQSSNDGERARPQRAGRQRSSSSDGVDSQRSSGDDRGERVRPQRAERQRSMSEPAQERRVWANRERRSRDGGVTTVATPTVTTPTVTTPTVVEAPGVRIVRPTDSGEATQVRRARRGDTIADQLLDMRRARTGDAVVVDRDRTTTPTRTENRYSGSDRRWRSDWRSDRRYDWRRYRDRNRSIFRFGSYYDPYGYSYRRFSTGFNLWPSYYGSSFWLNDPWMYRLPPAYGPYRWVRYWDDALLVNIYTGQVVDVVHNFFW